MMIMAGGVVTEQNPPFRGRVPQLLAKRFLVRGVVRGQSRIPGVGLKAGLKVDPKAGLKAGLKMDLKAGLKVDLKAGLKVDPKAGLKAGLKADPEPGAVCPPSGGL